MKRKHKLYSRPKRPFDKARIEEENKIKEEFGLKNKKEIWKADAKIKLMREKAKNLIKSSPEEQKKLIKQLQKIGLKVNSLAEILGLDKKDYLERRLQTIVAKKQLVTTVKAARQAIVHKKILVDNKVINKPSYIVPVGLENKISKKQKNKVEKIPEHEKTPEEEKLELRGVSKEIPKESGEEVAEEIKKVKEEIKEHEAEFKGK